MRSKAVVLQVEGDSAVVLKEGGEFLRVPLRGRRWQVGQEVLLEDTRRRLSWRWPVAWAAAAALLLTVVAAAVVTPVSAESSYITVDTGAGSVGLVTGEDGEVVEVVPLDPGAGDLLEQGLGLKGQPVDRAIVRLVEQAAAQGPVAAEPGMVLIGAAPLQPGEGLPPAVSEAVERARQEAAGLLQERGSPAPTAVIEVDDPQVGPSLGRMARQRRFSVSYSVLWAARQVAAERASLGDLSRVLPRLAQVPGEELWRSGKPDATVAAVLKSWLDGRGEVDLAGSPRHDAAGLDREPARVGGGPSTRSGAGRGEERGERQGDQGSKNTRGAGRERRDDNGNGRGGGGNRSKGSDRGHPGDRGDGQRPGTAIDSLPKRPAGSGLAGRQASGDEEDDGNRSSQPTKKKDKASRQEPGGGDRDGESRQGNTAGRGGFLRCEAGKDEAGGSRALGAGDRDGDRYGLRGFLRGVLESILCREN